MALLLQTDIEQKVNTCMTGLLARVGGKVDQLCTYKRCVVEDINVVNLRSRKFGRSAIGRFRYFVDLLEQEVRFWRKGYHAVRDRKTHFVDMHDAKEHTGLHKRYDGVMSSNVIEHSYDVIRFLLNMHALVKSEGYHFHAIPCYRYTFDQFRSPTPVEHMIDDFIKEVTKDNLEEHSCEHYASASRWDKVKCVTKPSFPHIHCHVFDEHNTKALFELVFQDVTVDVINTDQFGDVLVLCRNKLNPAFRERFDQQLSKYPL
jgi:hypothetical protein